jgi:uncharacterized protein YhfF
MSDTFPEPTPLTDAEEERAGEVLRFWEAARARAGLGRLSMVTGPGVAASVTPPVGMLGRHAADADRSVRDVLDGRVRGTSTVHAELTSAGEGLPGRGDLWIVVDGSGHPRALVRTTSIAVVPFGEVDDEHARAEGYADAAEWREAVRAELEERAAAAGEALSGATAVVLERFEVAYP